MSIQPRGLSSQLRFHWAAQIIVKWSACTGGGRQRGGGGSAIRRLVCQPGFPVCRRIAARYPSARPQLEFRRLGRGETGNWGTGTGAHGNRSSRPRGVGKLRCLTGGGGREAGGWRPREIWLGNRDGNRRRGGRQPHFGRSLPLGTYQIQFGELGRWGGAGLVGPSRFTSTITQFETGSDNGRLARGLVTGLGRREVLIHG